MTRTLILGLKGKRDEAEKMRCKEKSLQRAVEGP